MEIEACKTHYSFNKCKNPNAATSISEKVNFKTESFNRGKERHFTVVKGAIHQENLTILNAYLPSKYMKQTKYTKMKQEKKKLLGDFHIIVRT